MRSSFIFIGLLLLVLGLLDPQPANAAPGNLDSSFGIGGKVTTAVGSSYAVGQGVAVQSDGKIVVAGYYYNGSNEDILVIRYNADGGLDTTFNGTGKVTTGVGTGNDSGKSVVMQSDQKIVVGGSYSNGSTGGFALVRYNIDGTLDTTFNSTGKVTVANGVSCRSVALQTDGKFVIAGSASDVSGNHTYFAITRCNSDGSLDTGFGTNGKVTTEIGTMIDAAESVVIQNDGKIVLAGDTIEPFGDANFAVARYNSDGTLDSGFGVGGKVITNFVGKTDEAYGVKMQQDGKIVVAGRAYTGTNNAFALARYNSDGTLDTTFNGTGKAMTVVSSSSSATGLIIQADGKITLAGSSYNGSNDDLALVRYNSDGSLDASFGIGGEVSTDFGFSTDSGRGVALQADGKVVVVGTYNKFGTQIALARYQAQDTPSNADLLNLVPGSGSLVPTFSPAIMDYSISVSSFTSSTLVIPTKADSNASIKVNDVTVASGSPSGLINLAFGPNQILTVVTAQDGTTTKTYTLNVTRIGSSNANLSALSLSAGTLSPSFAAGMINYTSNVSFATSSLTVTPTVADATATVRVNGTTVSSGSASSPVTLNVGENTIAVAVSAQDGTTIKTYTLVVTRAPGSSNADLTNLVLSTGPLIPAFSSGTQNYSASVANGTTSIRLTPTKADANASITVNGVTVTSGNASGAINLAVGLTTITTVVTAQDGTTKTYTLDVTRAERGPGDVETDFQLALGGASPSVYTTALQPDGRIVIGGLFNSAGGITRNNVARINADGSLDAGFNPNVNSYVRCLAIQTDGKVIIGGEFTTIGTTARNRLARMNADGSLDTSFNPNVNGNVHSMAVQADGKIIIAGLFTSIGATPRKWVARLLVTGAVDTTFDPGVGANGGLFHVALQPDGKVLIGGMFTTVGGAAHTGIARLNANGSVDTGFVSPALGGTSPSIPTVSCTAVQPDGKVVIGGTFVTVGGVNHVGVARLNANGSLDTSMSLSLANSLLGNVTTWSMALQADGKLLIGGMFDSAGGLPRNGLVRLNPSGNVDTGFVFGGPPNMGGSVGFLGVTLLADGKVLIAGPNLVGTTPFFLTRLTNDAATQSLITPASNRVQWLRGGAAPETQQVGFEVSTNGGITWSALGNGARITGGWELTGVSLPGNGVVRGRARITGGTYSGSSGVIYSSASTETASPTVTTGAVSDLTSTSVVLEGMINPNGSATTGEFRYGTTITYTDTVTVTLSPSNGSIPQNVTAAVSGLLPSTTYHYRLSATNALGPVNGDDATFTTPGPAPIVITSSATTINSTGATLNGSINPNGAATTAAFEWGTSPTLATFSTLAAGTTNAGTAPVAVNAVLTGLTTGSTYYFRLKGTRADSATPQRGAILSFVPAVSPDIAVECPVGSGLTNGVDGIDYGPVIAGIGSNIKLLMIKNTGTANLSGLSITKDGTAAADFKVEMTGMKTTLTPGSSTTFTVTFSASALGARTAVLHIASNDPDEAPFNITLSGTGAPGILFENKLTLIEEEAGTVDVPIKRMGSYSGAVSVRVNSTPGTATVADFGTVSNALVSFADGESTKSVTVNITPDSVTESNETFTLTLSDPQGGAVIGTGSTTTVRIIDLIDTVKPDVTIITPAANASVAEGTAVTVTGSASDKKGVRKVQVSLNGGLFVDAVTTLAANGLTAAYTAPLAVAPGVNTVAVQSIDTRNNLSSVVTHSITYHVPRTLQVTLNGPVGSGTVTAGFEPSSIRDVNMPYTITATPKTGFVFDGWTANDFTDTGVTPEEAELPALTFIMQENLHLTASFIANPFATAAGLIGAFNGPVSPSPDEPAGGTEPDVSTVGHFSAAITTTGSFSGTLKIDGVSLPITTGKFDNDGVARFGTNRATTLTLKRKSKPDLEVALQLDMSGTSDTITGTVTQKTGSVVEAVSDVEAERAVFSSKSPAPSALATVAGQRYNLIFPARVTQAGLTTDQFPQGTGIGSMIVKSDGTVTFAGTLADNTTFTASTTLSEEKQCPLFVQLYSLKGSIAGLVTLDTTQTGSDALGLNCLWIRPPQPTLQWYPAGWPDSIGIDLIAAKFSIPTGLPAASVIPGLGIVNPNATLSFVGGLLAGSGQIDKDIHISPTNVVTEVPADSSFTIGLTKTTGEITGIFTHSDTRKPTYKATTIQKAGPYQGTWGFFMTMPTTPVNHLGQSGDVRLLPK